MCESYYKQYGCNFYSVMPTNLYGPNDNYDLNTSHVLPALIRKVHEAKVGGNKETKGQSDKVVVWGTGKPRREFMYVDDLADAVYYLINTIDAKDLYAKEISLINVGTGEDLTIAELAELIKKIVGCRARIIYDFAKPDGTPQKTLDITRMNNLGWHRTTSLFDGIKKTYKWYEEKVGNLAKTEESKNR